MVFGQSGKELVRFKFYFEGDFIRFIGRLCWGVEKEELKMVFRFLDGVI